jgi:DNA polymerase-3 subunit epsilon
MRPIYYDTETTGINSKTCRVIELAAYDPASDRSFVELINPGMPIPAEAAAIHGITDAMVAGAPSFAEVGQRFLEFCGNDALLIAHNNDSFDILFMREEWARSSLEWPNWKTLDSLKWARRYRSDLPKHSLQFLREIYKIPENNAHRALDDVVTLYKVFQCMTDDLPIEKVYELLMTPQTITRMPFGKHMGTPLEQVPKSYYSWLQKSGALDKPSSADLKAALEQLQLIS